MPQAERAAHVPNQKPLTADTLLEWMRYEVRTGGGYMSSERILQAGLHPYLAAETAAAAYRLDPKQTVLAFVAWAKSYMSDVPGLLALAHQTAELVNDRTPGRVASHGWLHLIVCESLGKAKCGVLATGAESKGLLEPLCSLAAAGFEPQIIDPVRRSEKRTEGTFWNAVAFCVREAGTVHIKRNEADSWERGCELAKDRLLGLLERGTRAGESTDAPQANGGSLKGPKFSRDTKALNGSKLFRDTKEEVAHA